MDAGNDNVQPPGYTCPNCGRTSHNPNDLRERYCGWCHLFEGEDADDDVTRFRCTDCGEHVLALGLSVCALPPRCNVCAWLQEFVEPAEHAEYRKLLGWAGLPPGPRIIRP